MSLCPSPRPGAGAFSCTSTSAKPPPWLPALITGGSPYQVYAFDATRGTRPLSDGIEVTVSSSGGAFSCAVSIEAGAVKAEQRVRVYNLSTGSKREGVGAAYLSLPVDMGDPVLLVIEGVITAGDQVLKLSFNKSLSRYGDLSEHLSLQPIGSADTDIEVEQHGEQLWITPDPSWSGGFSSSSVVPTTTA